MRERAAGMDRRGQQDKNRLDGRQRAVQGAEALAQTIACLLAAVGLALCVAVPLYVKDGYHQIGNAKFEIYRRIVTGGFGVLLALAAVYCVCRIALRIRPAALSCTDKFVLAYLVTTGISVVSGGFYEDALWGSFGWNMGLFSQVSFVLLYLFFSRFGRYYRVVLAGLCVTAAIVFAFGILHRLLIDPLGFYEGLTERQKAQFLSTLGQATWYASFLVTTLPVGIGVFFYAARRKWRVLGGIYMLLGFCTLVTQNSDSAYVALAGALFVFFMVSCERREWMCRFTAALTLFFAAGKGMYLLMRRRPNPALVPDFVTELMWTSGLTWVLLAVCLVLTALLYSGAWSGRRKAGGSRGDGLYPAKTVRRIRRGTAGLAAGLLTAAVLTICLQSRGLLPAGIADRAASVSYLNWNDGWGNGRGRIWSFTCKVISQESLRHRLFGVGPDCFNSYISACHGEETVLLWGEKKLTNAHNEWLNILVNGGIAGAAAYLGIFVSAVCRCLRNRKKDFLLTAVGAACVSYMCYNFFCYQQVLCTPFLFILMGTGESILREQTVQSETYTEEVKVTWRKRSGRF